MKVTEMVVSAMSNFIVDEEGNLYSWGDNREGQLGLGDRESRDVPALVHIPFEMELPFVQLVASRACSIILDATGKLWRSGSYPTGSSTSFIPIRGFPNDVSSLSLDCSSPFYLIAITLDGIAWAIGTKDTWENVTLDKPSVLEGVPPVKRVCQGLSHVIFESVDGDLYSMGCNHHGEMGREIPTSDTYSELGKIKKPLGMASLVDLKSGGNEMSVILDSNGVVWNCGESLNLGRSGDYSLFEKVEGLPPLISISAGGHHTLGLDEDGNLWGWGFNGYRIISEENETIKYPVLLDYSYLNPSVRVFSGIFHSFVVTENGEVWALGNHSFLKWVHPQSMAFKPFIFFRLLFLWRVKKKKPLEN